MLKLHDYACVECNAVFEVLHDADDVIYCECGGEAERMMSAPAIHTLETHFRGYRDDTDGAWRPAHGEFRDENLCDRVTGEPLVYTSLADKQKKLKEQGLFEKPKTERTKRRSERRMLFSKEGSKRSQLGINH